MYVARASTSFKVGRVVMAAGVAAAAATGTGGVSPVEAVVPADESTCDFDGDGYEDLAIGVPLEDLESQWPTLRSAGVVHVVYGSATGPLSERSEVWNQNSPGLAWASESGDFFGWALVCGDFDGDGHDDLAISAALEDVPNPSDPDAPEVGNAGVVQLIYGSPAGLTADGNQWWTQDSNGLGDVPEPRDRFGTSLAAGDFDGDGRDDLAIGVEFEDLDGVARAGGVQVLYGSPSGPTATGNQWWDQATLGTAETREFEDRFGLELAVGDFDGDGHDDLAIGVPFEDIGSIIDAGGAHIVYGSASGLTASGSQWWYQDLPDVLGGSERGDSYGEHLAAGDFDGDGSDDLAVGIESEGSGTLGDSGAVHVMYGSSSGLTAADDQWWDQGSPGLLGALERWDHFGLEVSAGDFDGDGADDLAIGVGEEFAHPGAPYAGAIQVIYGTPSGLSASGNQWWDQASPGILGQAESGDGFPFISLVALDLDGDGAEDIVAGLPLEDLGSVDDAGAVQVVYGSPSGLTAVGNQWWDQNSPGIAGVPETSDRFGTSLPG